MGLPRYRIPPRRQPVPVNTMFKAQVRASRLTEGEIRETMDAVRHCATRTREGVATVLQVQTLRTTMLIALEIERLGYVRGMRGHIEAALIAIKSALTSVNHPPSAGANSASCCPDCQTTWPAWRCSS